MFSTQRIAGARLLCACVLDCLALLAQTLNGTPLPAQMATDAPPGVAWQVRGAWQIDGKGPPILVGDAILPGSLLQPADGTANHSITVLLPDGQRILYECFTAEDCARGFRVPSLNRTPDPFAVEMLAQIRSVLLSEDYGSSGSGSPTEPRLPRDEVVAALDSGNRVQVAGLAAKLPNGRYSYDLQPLDHAYPRQSHLLIEKSAAFVTIAVPSSGLYAVTISDDVNTPRIDLFIAAVSPGRSEKFIRSASDAKALMKMWDESYYGWPMHEFQRAYIDSLMREPDARSAGSRTVGADKIDSHARVPGGNEVIRGRSATVAAHPSDVSEEPVFLPKPGLLNGDTQVSLQSGTPGVIIHYTVDSSQPVASSPVYGAPILVKATGLTIKAFSSTAGKKDSAVVTGIFRILQP